MSHPGEEAAVQKILATISDPGDQLDAIAEARHWFNADEPKTAQTIAAYLSSALSLSQTVSIFADPVEEAYTSADYGRAFWRAEKSNRVQRRAWSAAETKNPKSPEEIENLYGLPVALCEPNPERADGARSVEGYLWELWYGVMHAARKLPWHNADAHNKLIDLVTGFKARPDPPQPGDEVGLLRNDWIYASRELWSRLLMLGPAARECWNDSPGSGAGSTEVEVWGWENLNAFVARLSARGVKDFWVYGVWALRDAVEGGRGGVREVLDRGLAGEIEVRTAAVWMRVVGLEIWEKAKEDQGNGEVDVETKAEKCPWYRSDDITRARWRFWWMRFALIAEKEKSSELARKVAAEVVTLMGELEGAARAL